MSHPHSPPISDRAPSPTATVVVVDDDPSLVEALTALLVAEGYRVDGFTNPLVALAHLRSGPLPDLAIVDCIMPSLTGTELCAALAEAGLEVPVVLMTALSDPSFFAHPEGGAVLNKPFQIDDLLLEVEGRLRPRSGARTMRRPGMAARG